MPEERPLIAPFLLEIGKNSTTVTPYQYAHRSSIPTRALSNSFPFETTNQDLNNACDDVIVVLARYGEIESRAKRTVCLEKLHDGLFSCSQLSNAVTIPTCKQRPQSRLEALKTGSSLCCIEFTGDDWWRSLEIEPEGLEQGLTSPCEATLHLDLGPQPVGEVSTDTDEKWSIDDIRRAFQTSYTEALYGSRTSLAFYAKSTLPRLRSRILESGQCLDVVAQILLADVVPNLTELDHKYKEILPQCVHSFISNSSFGGVLTETFQMHEQPILAWLTSSNDEMEKSNAALLIGKALPSLKDREYQLITLLLLEALDLKAHAEPQERNSRPWTTSKASNVQDAETLIDVLIDRLSIAQSLNFASHDDPLKTFCVEVIKPFYAARLPDLTQSLVQKCIAQDFLSFDTPPTPHRPPKSKRKQAPGTAAGTSHSAKLKRTSSAPANLLSEKRILPKKRNLGREISMSKRAPSFDIQSTKTTIPQRVLSFEERRRQKMEKEGLDRVQVGQTPSKPRESTNGLLLPAFAPQLMIRETSKASFMLVGETPSKPHSQSRAITETPHNLPQTPMRSNGHISQAPMEGIQDTPSGNSILFKLDSPSRPSGSLASRRSRIDFQSLMSSPDVAENTTRPPTFRKSVTFGGLDSSQNTTNMFDLSHETSMTSSSGNLFNNGRKDRSSSPAIPLSKADKVGNTADHSNLLEREQTLEDVFDWL